MAAAHSLPSLKLLSRAWYPLKVEAIAQSLNCAAPSALEQTPPHGKRVSRLNPQSEWITTDVPHLRIIPDELWSAAKQRQKHTRHAIAETGKLSAANRPRYLFFGLTKCGVCSAGFIMGSANRLSCFGARDQGRA